MADEIRDMGIFAAAGILVAVLIIAGVVTGGLRFPSLRLPSMVSNKGTLIIKLTDAPVELRNLTITIGNISALRVEHEEETWEKLQFVNGINEVTLDILKLRNVTRDLSITEILPGNYTKLRMTITSANATYMETGETEPITVPSGRIDIIVHFELKSGETTKLLVDMNADWVAISQNGRLRPVLKATAKVISGE